MVTVVETEDLTKRFDDVEAVRELDLSIPRGEVYGLLGLNGAGKTTTVRMLAGALPPTAGSARVLDTNVTQRPGAVVSEVGVVFGENLVPEPGFSAVRYLRHVGALHGLDRDTIDERARELFDVLALAEAERPIAELSSGNRRKVEIARALLHEPPVLFLDEPTRELDIPSKRELWRFVRRLVEAEDLTVVLSSHDVQEIATLCDRIGILRDGRLTWEGRPENLDDGDDGIVEALSQRLQGRGTSFQVV
jgi:ABC-2 type transport system ATP-binding protein